MPRTPSFGFPSAIAALLPLNLSSDAYICLKAREEVGGFPSLINSSGRPSHTIARRLSQENLLRDNPQVHRDISLECFPDSHPCSSAWTWAFLTSSGPASAVIHTRALLIEESDFCACGCPSHGYQFLVVHLGLPLPYSKLCFLCWQNL